MLFLRNIKAAYSHYYSYYLLNYLGLGIIILNNKQSYSLSNNFIKKF